MESVASDASVVDIRLLLAVLTLTVELMARYLRLSYELFRVQVMLGKSLTIQAFLLVIRIIR